MRYMSLPLHHTEPEGTSDPDLAAARSGSILALLGHLGVLQFSGEDAETFLQGQLSCDVAGVGLRSGSYGAYCSPKGRMLANFLLWREEAGFHMALSRDIAPSVHKQLSKFVMRAKVKVSDGSDTIVMAGAAGPKAGRALQEVFSDFPKQPNEVSGHPGIGTVINLQDGRFLLALAPPSAGVLRQSLANSLAPVKPGPWPWLALTIGRTLVSATNAWRPVLRVA